MSRWLAAVVCLVLLGAAAPVAAASPEDIANDVSANVMSPFCPGVTLHDCPSSEAIALRDRITEMAQAGHGRAAIMAELEREYGPTIRAVPPARGTGLLAWLLPIGTTLLVAATAWVFMSRWARHPDGGPDTGTDVEVTPEEHRRVDAELDALRGSP